MLLGPLKKFLVGEKLRPGPARELFGPARPAKKILRPGPALKNFGPARRPAPLWVSLGRRRWQAEGQGCDEVQVNRQPVQFNRTSSIVQFNRDSSIVQSKPDRFNRSIQLNSIRCSVQT